MGSRRLTRRVILAGGASAISGLAAAWGAAAPPARISSKSRDVIIRDIAFDFEDFSYRSPYAFGGESVERTTLLNVHITVEAAKGRLAKGFGSMPLGNVWAYPSRTLAYGQTMGAMSAAMMLRSSQSRSIKRRFSGFETGPNMMRRYIQSM